MRPPNPNVDPESVAARIASKFDRNGQARASGLAKAISRTPSTVQRWLDKGAIPAEAHAEIAAAATRLKIALKPTDFVDERVFARPGKGAKAEATA
jgi:hypothetical protein